MPWKKVTPMEEIIRFVTLVQTDRFTVTDLCEQFGISRKTGRRKRQTEGVGACGLWFGVAEAGTWTEQGHRSVG